MSKPKRPVGRPPGSKATRKKKQDTICLHQEDWDKLDKIGPSRGRAVERLIIESEDDE